MQDQGLSDTHIVCAPLPLNPRRTETVFRGLNSDIPISWYGTLDTLQSMSHTDEAVCLEMSLGDIASKHRFRTQLHLARRSFPHLNTIVAPQAGQIHHRELLVQEGISVILTHSYSTTSSPRRPVPMGWPCRNVQWGLWEVLRDTRTQQGQFQTFLSFMTRRQQQKGILKIWDTASKNGNYDHKKFSKITRRIHKLVSKKSATVIRLDQLPDLISRGTSRADPSSILKAA